MKTIHSKLILAILLIPAFLLTGCKSEKLNADGMVTDFTQIKRQITSALDHRNLNDVFDFNPTAENIARWICDHVENAYKVEVWESEMNMAAYER